MFHKQLLGVILGLCLSMTPNHARAGEQRPALRSIAVIEFEAKGVSELEASALSDCFRSELVRTRGFTQIERSRIEQILMEQELQMTGLFEGLQR